MHALSQLCHSSHYSLTQKTDTDGVGLTVPLFWSNNEYSIFILNTSVNVALFPSVRIKWNSEQGFAINNWFNRFWGGFMVLMVIEWIGQWSIFYANIQSNRYHTFEADINIWELNQTDGYLSSVICLFFKINTQHKQRFLITIHYIWLLKNWLNRLIVSGTNLSETICK